MLNGFILRPGRRELIMSRTCNPSKEAINQPQWRPMLGFFVAALFTFSGIANVTLGRFHEKAASEIASKLQGGSVQVSTELADVSLSGHLKSATISAKDFATQGLPLFTEPERSKRGRIDTLRIDLDNFSLRKLRVKHLSATIPNCRYDFGLATRHSTFRLSQSGEGKGTVEIRQEDLTAFILSKFKEIKSVSVEAAKDKVWVRGHGDFLMISTDFEVLARLESPDGRTLVLTDCRIWFDGERASEGASAALLKTLNPVVDLDADLGLAGAVDIQKIETRNGLITVVGKTRIPVRPTLPVNSG